MKKKLGKCSFITKVQYLNIVSFLGLEDDTQNRIRKLNTLLQVGFQFAQVGSRHSSYPKAKDERYKVDIRVKYTYVLL